MLEYDITIIELLLQNASTDVNQGNNDGVTPFYNFCVYHNNMLATKALLEDARIVITADELQKIFNTEMANGLLA